MENVLYKRAQQDLELRLTPKELKGTPRYDILAAVNMMQADGYAYILESNSITKQLIITFEKKEEENGNGE